MEVILIKDVDKLGYANDIVDVRPGYANNYLIPQGLAKSATASARKILAENLKQQAHKEAKLVGDAEALAGQDRRNLAEADGQGRGRTHFRIDHGGSPGRSPRSQGHHGGSQEHLAGCSEDDRSLRSLCQNLQRNFRDRSFRGGRRRVRQSFLNKDSAPFHRKRGAVFIHATAVTPVGDFPAETIRPKRPPFRQATLRGLPAEKTDSP